MNLRTLASGSSGNCLLLSAGRAHLLVDAGVSRKRVTEALRPWGLSPASLSGVLVTHEHTDHIAGLATLTKYHRLPIYTSPGTALWLAGQMSAVGPFLHPVSPGERFQLGPFTVEPFPTSHDAAQPMGFVVSAEGRRAAVATDLGFVSDEVLDAVLGAHLVVCEANHDTALLRAGPYPYPLKVRILSDRGHLSNAAGAALAVQCVERGAKTILLAHLSAQNNTPELALSAARSALLSAGVDPDRDVVLAAAPRSEPSPLYEV